MRYAAPVPRRGGASKKVRRKGRVVRKGASSEGGRVVTKNQGECSRRVTSDGAALVLYDHVDPATPVTEGCAMYLFVRVETYLVIEEYLVTRLTLFISRRPAHVARLKRCSFRGEVVFSRLHLVLG